MLEILKNFEMECCNIVITPPKPRQRLSKDEDEQDVDPTQYWRLIGSLHHLYNMRPNLVFSVDTMSKFIEIQKVSHLEAIKRILGYIK